MQNKKRSSGPLTRVLISFLFLTTASNAKASGPSPIVEAQANTTTSSATAPMEGQGNTSSATATGVSELPEVTVKAKGIDQAAAFDEMHDSINKVNVLSQDQINQTPAKSVVQAAEQLPGVGTSHDTSEARYLSIRGTDPDFDIITFNQSIIPSYDKASRSVELDAIPAGLFGELQLYKTILPDMDAQGIGGQLNLDPKYAKDYPGGVFELQVEGEFFPERNQPGVRGQLTWADTYNMGGKTDLGILVTANYQYSRFGIDDLENDYTPQGSNQLTPGSVSDWQLRYYDYERDRAGMGTNVNLDLDRDNKLYANLFYAGYDEYRNPDWHTEYHGLDATTANGATTAADGTVTIPATSVSVRKTMEDELTQFRDLAANLGGKDDLGGFLLDYNASFAYTEDWEPFNYNYRFDSNPFTTGSYSYNNSGNNGNFPVLNNSGLNGADTNPSNYTLNAGKTNNGTADYEVASYGARADGKFDIPLGGDDTSTLKFGANARLEYSTFTNANYNVTPGGSTLSLSQILGPTNINYYNGLYNLGPEPSYPGLPNLLNATNPYEGPYVQTDPNGDKGGNYTNWEDVYAGYAMYTLKSGPMEIMAGARIEATHISYNWYQAYQLLANGDPDTNNELPTPIAETGTIDYANVMPSLGFKYTFNPQVITRMNFSQTISRPTQAQYIPSFSLGQALSAQSSNSLVSFTFGNPNLKPIVSNNIDFSLEVYPQKAAIFGVDFFLKDIRNYIALNYQSVDNGTTDDLNYFNIPTADIYGAEFQYQQQYTMLPDPLDGLGVRASISAMGSDGEIASGLYGELPFQSDLIWEGGLFYKKGGFTIDVAGNFTGRNLMVVGDPNAPNSPNQYRDDWFQINAKAQYAFSKDFSIYADGDNLNNANLRYYNGSTQFPIQNEFYQPSFDAGIDVTF